MHRRYCMTITFTGHAFVSSYAAVKEKVKQQLRAYVDGARAITFYLGGYGSFDEICAAVCRELKQEYEGIELVYVTPYISLSEQDKIRRMTEQKLIDASVYPPIEGVPPRLAILKRNEWMIQNADLVIAYIDHEYGGAYKAYQYAKHKNKKIINICDEF